MQHQRRFVADPPKRVLMFGSPGSGRARLAEALSKKFSLPIVSLDRERRAESDIPGWRRRLAELGHAPTWVMTGADLDALGDPLRRADWLVLLNLPMSFCLMQALRASLPGSKSPAVSDVETGFWAAVRGIWEFPTEIAPHVSQAIERERRNRTIFILHTGRDLARFVSRLPDCDDSRSGPAQSDAPPK